MPADVPHALDNVNGILLYRLKISGCSFFKRWESTRLLRRTVAPYNPVLSISGILHLQLDLLLDSRFHLLDLIRKLLPLVQQIF